MHKRRVMPGQRLTTGWSSGHGTTEKYFPFQSLGVRDPIPVRERRKMRHDTRRQRHGVIEVEPQVQLNTPVSDPSRPRHSVSPVPSPKEAAATDACRHG